MGLGADDVVMLLERRGSRRYGRERVSQLEHALQCAALAEREGASPMLVTAALLHDLGHLLADPDDTGHDADDIHQFVAIPFLRGLVPDPVLEPIRLHVDAKRWLCRTEPGYRERLSPASVASLERQGGLFDRVEAEAFVRRPFACDAIRLRRWDDRAKVAGAITPPLDYFADLLRRFENRGQTTISASG
jgi:phosphonate degradation associated HDIG domain protein